MLFYAQEPVELDDEGDFIFQYGTQRGYLNVDHKGRVFIGADGEDSTVIIPGTKLSALCEYLMRKLEVLNT